MSRRVGRARFCACTIGILVVLVGCATPQTESENYNSGIENNYPLIQSPFATEYATCSSDKSIITVSALEACELRLEYKYFTNINFPWMDLFYINAKERLTVAQKIDARQISMEAGIAEFNDADNRMSAAIERRTNAVANSQTLPQGQYSEGQIAAMGLAARMLSPSPRPPMTIQVAPTQTTCQRIGDQVICTTQ